MAVRQDYAIKIPALLWLYRRDLYEKQMIFGKREKADAEETILNIGLFKRRLFRSKQLFN